VPDSARRLYRIAAVLFLLFAAGHTAGFLTFRPASADALAVWDSMNRVHIDGTSVTWSGFYIGFGLFVSVYLLFSALLAWRLGGAGEAEVNMVRGIAWMLITVQVANIVLCIHYFGPLQAIFAGACAFSLVSATLKTRLAPG
jgi:hypothetical protein